MLELLETLLSLNKDQCILYNLYNNNYLNQMLIIVNEIEAGLLECKSREKRSVSNYPQLEK